LGCSGQGDQAWTNNEAQAWGAADGEGPESGRQLRGVGRKQLIFSSIEIFI